MSARKSLSLVFVRKPDGILLGFKKRGYGSGKWNGFGGKLEPNETMLQAAVRELNEECGLITNDLHRIGLIEFEFEGNPIYEVHIFETYNYHGKLAESEEMRPRWYDLNSIPFESMWPDNAYWFPHLLRGEPFKAYFLYRGLDHIVKYKIEKLDSSKFEDVQVRN